MKTVRNREKLLETLDKNGDQLTQLLPTLFGQESKSLSMCHRSTGILGRASISFQCFISFRPLLLPTMTRPISSLDPMWSWSITEMERAVRRIRSHATLNTKDSLKLGSVVLCFVCVFCFSIFLPSCSNQIFTYGSEQTTSIFITHF